MGVIEWIDIGTPIGSGTAVGVGDLITNVSQTPCDEVCDEIIQGEIICNLNDAWNNNLCSNDLCYYQPVVPGDCLNFQFQFQNTRNAKGAISFQRFQQRPNPKIQYGWYHHSVNPTNWTMKALMYDACTGQEYKDGNNNNYADTLIEQATIFLSQDRKASAKTLPVNSWYRWTQNIRLCIPAQLPANWPKQFYFVFQVREFTNTVTKNVYSQLFEIDTCNSTILLGGMYTLKDCFGYDYSNPNNFGGVVNLGPRQTDTQSVTPFNQVISANFLKSPTISGQYNNTHRIKGTANYVGRLIEKDIPERQCLSIKTSVKEQYDIKAYPMPPYMAEIVNNALSGQVAYLTGVPGYGTIEVQPNSGAVKNNDISNMWVVDITVNGCECLDYHQC